MWHGLRLGKQTAMLYRRGLKILSGHGRGESSCQLHSEDGQSTAMLYLKSGSRPDVLILESVILKVSLVIASHGSTKICFKPRRDDPSPPTHYYGALGMHSVKYKALAGFTRFSRLLPTPSWDKTCSTINFTENIYLLKMYLMLPPLILHTWQMIFVLGTYCWSQHVWWKPTKLLPCCPSLLV